MGWKITRLIIFTHTNTHLTENNQTLIQTSSHYVQIKKLSESNKITLEIHLNHSNRFQILHIIISNESYHPIKIFSTLDFLAGDRTINFKIWLPHYQYTHSREKRKTRPVEKTPIFSSILHYISRLRARKKTVRPVCSIGRQCRANHSNLLFPMMMSDLMSRERDREKESGVVAGARWHACTHTLTHSTPLARKKIKRPWEEEHLAQTPAATCKHTTNRMAAPKRENGSALLSFRVRLARFSRKLTGIFKS